MNHRDPETDRRWTAMYIADLEAKIAYLESYNAKYGEHPYPGKEDTDEVANLRSWLAEARAQRDVTQKALDKANRDNDALRAELRALGRAGQTIARTRPMGEREVRALVDGGEGYFVEDEEK